MSWRLPRTTFGLVALASSGLCLVTLVLGGAVYVVSHEALEQQLDHRIEAESTMLVAMAKSGGTAAVAAAIRRREDGHRLSELGYMLVDRHGRRLAKSSMRPCPSPDGMNSSRSTTRRTAIAASRRHRRRCSMAACGWWSPPIAR